MEVISEMTTTDLPSQKDWPSAKLRLALLISFGGLLALTVIAGLDALRVARELQSQEEKARQSFLARSQSLSVLCTTIHVYSDRVQEFMLSDDPQTQGPTSQEFASLAAEIDTDLNKYPKDREAEEQALLATLQSLFAEQEKILVPVLSWSPEERRREAMHFLTEEVLPRRIQILDTSEKIAVWNRQRLSDADKDLFASFASLQEKQAGLLITALAAGLLLSLASIFYILRLERQAQLRYEELAVSRGELERLSTRLVDAQEMERRSISRELHDEVGQALGALLVDAGRLSALVPSGNKELKDYVDRIKTVAEGLVRTVRDIALLLRPSMLDDLGLVAALEWQGREISRRGEMEVEVQSENVSETMSDEYKICIYRLVQEALHNAARHGSGKNARVSVRQTDENILVTVEDDGRGFDPQRVRGLGILGMEERVKRLGGTLHIESKPGQGTTLTAELPLRESDAHATYEEDSSAASRRS